MSAEPADRGSSASVLEALIAHALEAIERGESVDAAALCADRPDLLAPLEASLRRLRQLPSLHREAVGRDLSLGAVLVDRYRLEERIGTGAMGVVYRAQDLQLGRQVAIKVLRPELVVGARMDLRLAREAQVLASIRHRNVVTVHDCGRAADGRSFVVMELLHGTPIGQLLRDESGSKVLTGERRLANFRRVLGDRCPLGDNDVRQVVAWIADAAAGVDAAHAAGVVHRDVKPSNLFLERDGRLIVLDFGIVSSGSHATIGSDGSPMGTPSYMAPEQLDVGAAPDRRSDVYGLAATLYHLLTGRAPFVGSIQQVLASLAKREPARADRIRPGLPADLLAIVEKGMAKAAAQRYQTAAALRDDLLAWLEFRPVSARRVSWLTAAWRRAKRSPAVRAVAVVFAVLLAGVAWTSLAAARRDARQARSAELWTHVPPALLNEPRRFRATSAMRSAAELQDVLDGLVACTDDGVALALRALWRADRGDFTGAADDAQAIVALGDAPYATFALAEYRAGRVPDPTAEAQQGVACGGTADRALAFLHALRVGVPSERWGEQLLTAGDAPIPTMGFAEFDLVLRVRRALAAGDFYERVRLCQAIEQDVARLEAIRGRPSAIGSLVLANSLLTQARFAEARRAAEAGYALAPLDFSLRIVGGSAALESGDTAAAVAQFRRAIELQGSSVHAREMLCDALIARDELDAAEAVVTEPSLVAGDDGRYEKQHGLVTFARARRLLDPADATAEQRQAGLALVQSARTSFANAGAKGVEAALETILCDRYLGDRSSCAPMLEWLAERPLDSEMIRVVSRSLPATLAPDEVAALNKLLMSQATALGARSR